MVERATYENIVNLYLYGEFDTPDDLCARLRDLPSDAFITANVDVAEFMTSVGRFAHAAGAAIVGQFFGGELDPAQGITDASGVTRFTVGQILAANGDDRSSINISVSQYTTGTYEADYGERAFRADSVHSGS